MPGRVGTLGSPGATQWGLLGLGGSWHTLSAVPSQVLKVMGNRLMSDKVAFFQGGHNQTKILRAAGDIWRWLHWSMHLRIARALSKEKISCRFSKSSTTLYTTLHLSTTLHPSMTVSRGLLPL